MARDEMSDQIVRLARDGLSQELNQGLHAN
jgi:hypothetical protein